MSRQQLVERAGAVDNLPLKIDGVRFARERTGAVPLGVGVPHSTVLVGIIFTLAAGHFLLQSCLDNDRFLGTSLGKG